MNLEIKPADFKIKDGDSNEVCLAKCMMAVAFSKSLESKGSNLTSFLASEMALEIAIEQGLKYASEVLDARDD